MGIYFGYVKIADLQAVMGVMRHIGSELVDLLFSKDFLYILEILVWLEVGHSAKLVACFR